MKQIKFCKNWNNELNNTIFTTIRKYSEEKYEYYKEILKEEFEVILNDSVIKKAELIRIDVLKYCDIPEYVLVLDTGETNFIGIQNIFEKFGMKDIRDKMMILSFKTIEGDD